MSKNLIFTKNVFIIFLIKYGMTPFYISNLLFKTNANVRFDYIHFDECVNLFRSNKFVC